MTGIQSAAGMQVANVALLAPSWAPSMQPATIICDNTRAGSAPCGESALVRIVHYTYGTDSNAGSSIADQTLREARYEIDCPRCGKRTQVVRY